MKKFAFTLAIAMLALYLPAAIVLTISPSGDGNMQIIASIPNEPARYQWVLQSSTNFLDSTPIATNLAAGGTFTNVVQATNLTTFYRLEGRDWDVA